MIYSRKAHYHETDQMGIVHHSNYIKWFEEARIQMMRELGIPYKEMEERGILSPVVSINCDYKNMVKFDDVVNIHVFVDSYNGIKFVIRYDVVDPVGTKTFAKGESKHCFISNEGKILSLKKVAADYHEKFLLSLDKEAE